MLLTQYWFGDLALVTLTLWICLYAYFTRKFNYWKSRNIFQIDPIPFFGNAVNVFTLRRSIGELLWDIHKKTTEPFIGFFICDEPCLLIRDVDHIKNILVKDFGIWNDRTMANNKRDDPMGSHILFLLKNPDWREFRRKITPVFTSGKMRQMHVLIDKSAQDLRKFVSKQVALNPVVETREVCSKFTTDSITSTSFGLEANCFHNENSMFRQVSRRVFNWHIWERGLSTTCYFVAPTLVKLFKLKFVDTFSTSFLREVFWKTMKERESGKSTSSRNNDLIDILIDIKNAEDIDDPYKLEGDKLLAQAVQFFIAGYETTASTISFTLYELAKNPQVQTRLRNEILSAKEKHNCLSYDVLKDIDYLDRCIKETLRKYPPLPFLDRRCNQDYKLPGTDIVLKKGTAVYISCLGLQYDPEFYPEPETYNPDRFLPEIVDSRPNFTYLPFGDGPRNCIGSRYGLLSSATGVAHIISEFELFPCDKTQKVMTFDPRGFLMAPVGGLYLKFRKL